MKSEKVIRGNLREKLREINILYKITNLCNVI